MKKITIIAALLLSANLFAQQNPTGPAIPVNSTPPTLQQHAWYRGGNFAGAAGGNKNIFGTMWNSPVYHYASSLQRMNVGFLAPGASLVGVGGNPNPMPANRLTRVAINRDGNAPIQRPLSLLHIGYDFPLLPQGGQRNWMDIGMMAMSGTDHVFLGLRQKSNTATGLPSTFLINPNDQQDAVLNWGDNDSGPDNLCFIYTAPPSFGVPRSSTNDGREMMRMIPNGNVGLGPVFSDGNQPKSNYHMHNENSLSNWLQITNENLPGVTQSNFPAASGTVNANDGFRIGILGHNNGQRNGNALIYNQENRHLLFSTNANTNNVTPNNTLERMRITSIAAPTSLANGGYGVYSPAGLNGNLTRVAISHDPQSPVTRPLSLLHLGYNTGAVGFNPASTDGWRDWMDIGIFTNNGTDNMYVGLKTEAGSFPANDRQDAVVNWGDNDASNPFNGPDNLRFIFTSTTTGSGNSPANSNKGLETMRINPDTASTMGGNFGMVGIGDYSPGSLNDGTLDAKLDIDGDLRIRTVTEDTTLFKVLVIDSADHNRVHWRSIADLGGNVTANNGISVTANNVVQLGVPCNVNGAPNIPGILASQFTEERVVPIRGYNLWFATDSAGKGGVGIGGQPVPTTFCGTGNTLEVSANGASKYGTTNSSGLRFTRLTSFSPTLPNGTNGLDNTKVLTVDSLGDVVLVDAVGGGNVTADNGLSIDPLNANNVQLGQECGSATSTANLLSDREIPLNDFNLIFSGQGTTGNNIGIGTTCTPIAKLQVDKTGTTTMSMSRGIYVHNSEQAANYSVGAQIYTDANSPYSRSIDVLATNSTIRNTGIHTSGWGGQDSYGINSGGGMATVRNVGVNGSAIAPGASVGWGVTGSATTSGGNTGENVGVYGSATGSLTQNFGGRFLANGSSGINYGVFAQAPNTSSTLGPHFAGYFAGDLLYTGQFGVSDQMFKKNIDSITDALSIISQLLPRTYLNDVINYSKLGFNDSKQYGFVAQEVELVLPELVGKGIHPDEYDTNGVKINSSFDFKTLNYQAFIPILTKGIQEQQLVIDSMSNTIQIQDSINNDLETRLAYLESCIRNANICEEGNRTLNNELNNATNHKSVELVNTNSIILDQNMPNPFAENTVINYNIPTDVMEAKLLFYDLNGRIIKELIIEERGESKLTVYGNNLKTGVYTYSLIADGELIATKKMVKK